MAMKLVVGLGNPGSRYEQTRHNVGFEVLRELARRHGSSRATVKFEAELVELFLDGEKLVLLAPQTYMNESGRSVRKCFDFYQPAVEEIVVICDDMNLELGRLRWRGKGSAGGQKGLNDILRKLGTDDVPRLRIGVGRPPQGWDAADYVLSRFRADEAETAESTLRTAADSVEVWVREGIEACQNRFNTARETESE